MATTSNPNYNAQTEALDVAKAFHEEIKGKIVIITGVNLTGIGFSAAEAFVSNIRESASFFSV
jgi:hypothetical protein